MSLPEVIVKGSVKNIRGIKDKSPYIFEFSDRYSAFDWGEMPDQIDDKGKSLAFMAWAFFDFLGNSDNWKNWNLPENMKEKFNNSSSLEYLKEKGLDHHALGLVDENGNDLGKSEWADKLQPNLAVKPMQILHPKSLNEDGDLKWDYSIYKENPTNALVPLEVIFRFGVPEGSSLLKRASDEKYWRSLGLETEPKAGDIFDIPVIEFSTKLENYDRYISYEHAKEIANLTDAEFKSLWEKSTLTALRLKDLFKEMDVELWDGKFEFAFGENREIIIIDSIGPDELRLTHKGVGLSKQVLRNFYEGSAWLDAALKSKKIADERGVTDWKNICINELKLSPPRIDANLKQSVAMMYKAISNKLSNKLYGHDVFKDSWDLEKTASELKINSTKLNQKKAM